MDLIEAEQLAKKLINQHCPEYTFRFDRSKKRFGCCFLIKKEITLSKYLAELNTYEDVEQCILHEIAHALVPFGENHGKLWKQKARAIGFNGTRTHTAKMPEPKYIYKCPHCGAEYKQMRKSTRQFNCGVCYNRTKVKYPLELIK